MSNLTVRILTALVAIPMVIGLILWGAHGAMILCMTLSLLGLWEGLEMLGIERMGIRLTATAVWAIAWSGISYLVYQAGPLPLSRIQIIGLTGVFIAVHIMTACFVYVFDKSWKLQPGHVGIYVLTPLYTVVPFIALFAFAHTSMGYLWEYILGVFVLVWSTDSFAYFGGRLYGRRKLFESVSPKKTWEGAITGFVMTGVLGAGWWYFLTSRGINDWRWLVYGGITGILCQIGDLFESKLKRQVGVKDSGTIIPGHGGILDRFDGFYFSILGIYIAREIMIFLS